MKVTSKKAGISAVAVVLLLLFLVLPVAAADNQTVVDANVANLTVTVDDTVLGWGYQVKVDNSPILTPVEKTCVVSVSRGNLQPEKLYEGGSTVQIVIGGETGLPAGWYLSVTSENCSYEIPENPSDSGNENLVKVYDFTADAASVTITAHNGNTWRVSFDANGGTGTMSPEYVIKGSSMVLPACGFTAPSGMLFSSWRIGSSFYEAGATYTPGADVTAYATWKSVGGSGSSGSATAYCLVQFETYDESIQIEDQYLMEGSLVKEPETPVEEGFVFGGWYTKEGKIWNFSEDRVYYSMTLYAKWVPVEDRPPVNPVEPVTPVETPLGLIGVIAGLGAAAFFLRRR